MDASRYLGLFQLLFMERIDNLSVLMATLSAEALSNCTDDFLVSKFGVLFHCW